MKRKIFIMKSNRKGKKLMVVDFPRKIHFGANGYSDFTIHKDPKRKDSYDRRHGNSNEDWNNPNTAGFWAKWILFNKQKI
jgi:hypothetical protein